MEESGDGMNRRGVLSMLGIGAAAGPALISQGATPAYLSTSSPFIGKDNAIAEMPWNPVDHLAQLKKEYEVMTGDSSAWIADFVAREYEEYMTGYSSYRLETIDPDIRNMKSISESAKMRMFFARKAKRRYESNSRNLFERIKELTGQI
jgi:hypothetical protein